MEILFSEGEMLTEDFEKAKLGYKTDYRGFAVYFFRSPARANRYYVMTM